MNQSFDGIRTSDLTHNTLFCSESLAENLLHFLTSRLKCHETAADLTHETYLRLDRKIKQSPPDDARALAFRIALNLAIDLSNNSSATPQSLDDGEENEIGCGD